jgi:hypothetical protein
MLDLLIHADPGARAGFVSAWLLDNLQGAGFDVGATVPQISWKCHGRHDEMCANVPRDPSLPPIVLIKEFTGTKIYIKTTFEQLSLQLLLFLRKNIYSKWPNFTRDEYSIQTFSEMYGFIKNCFDDEKYVDWSLYDRVITFTDTFDMDKMIELYRWYNHRDPTEEHIQLAKQNNEINQITVDPNNACSIAAMVFETETTLNLLEENRYWSLPAIYQTIPTNELYQTIRAKIVPENYSQVLI